MECMKCLNEDAKKKKKKRKNRTNPVHCSRNQITTIAKLLDTMHRSYGVNVDLIEVIN